MSAISSLPFLDSSFCGKSHLVLAMGPLCPFAQQLSGVTWLLKVHETVRGSWLGVGCKLRLQHDPKEGPTFGADTLRGAEQGQSNTHPLRAVVLPFIHQIDFGTSLPLSELEFFSDRKHQEGRICFPQPVTVRMR